MWLFFGNPNHLFWKQRRRRSTTNVSIKCRSEYVSGRSAGIRRWIDKRGYKVLKRNYRFLGKKKLLWLHSLQKARFQSTWSLRKTDCFHDENSIRNQWWYKLEAKTFGKGTWNFLRNWFAGRRSFSLGIVLYDLVPKLGSWDPWKATRVGEASHPGPKETSVDQGDAQLAAALMDVLVRFQFQSLSIPKRLYAHPRGKKEKEVCPTALRGRAKAAWFPHFFKCCSQPFKTIGQIKKLFNG